MKSPFGGGGCHGHPVGQPLPPGGEPPGPAHILQNVPQRCLEEAEEELAVLQIGVQLRQERLQQLLELPAGVLVVPGVGSPRFQGRPRRRLGTKTRPSVASDGRGPDELSRCLCPGVLRRRGPGVDGGMAIELEAAAAR